MHLVKNLPINSSKTSLRGHLLLSLCWTRVAVHKTTNILGMALQPWNIQSKFRSKDSSCNMRRTDCICLTTTHIFQDIDVNIRSTHETNGKHFVRKEVWLSSLGIVGSHPSVGQLRADRCGCVSCIPLPFTERLSTKNFNEGDTYAKYD